VRYLNFDVETFDFAKDPTGYKFKVRVRSSPQGEQDGTGTPSGLDERALAIVKLLDGRKSYVREDLFDLGKALADALFPAGTPRDLLLRSYGVVAGKQDVGLRVRLWISQTELAALPWEYVCDPQSKANRAAFAFNDFLALRHEYSIVRYRPMGKPAPNLDPVDSVRLVALFANPPETQALDLAKEQTVIAAALAAVPRIRPVIRDDATADDLREAVRGSPHVLHFSGHGVFQPVTDDEGKVRYDGRLLLHGGPMNAEQLFMAVDGRGIRLAVLTACETGKDDGRAPCSGVGQALTNEGIAAVLAMQHTIGDRCAIEFSKRFYALLAGGAAIDEAVLEGRKAIVESQGLEQRDWGTPVLYLRADDGVLFPSAAVASTQSARPATRAAAPPAATDAARVDRRKLRERMVQAFSETDLAELCVNVQEALEQAGKRGVTVDLEIVGGANKTAKVMNLIDYLNKRGLLQYLVDGALELRPELLD
jgi:hypothetical protein